MKKEKANHIGTILLTILLTLTMPLNVLASTTSSGAITIQEQWAYNVYNNFQTLLQDSLKVSVPKSESDKIWNEYIDYAYNIWNLNHDDLQSHYGHFREYVGSQFEMEKNSDNTYNYNMSEDAYTFIQDSFNTYMQDNPLSYTACYVKSYNSLSPNQFPSYAQYNQTKDFIKNSNGFCILNYNLSYGQMADVYICVIPRTVDYNLIGTTNNGLFTSVHSYIGWTQTGQPQVTNSNCYVKIIRGDGSISDLSGYNPSFNNIYNRETVASLGDGNIFTNNSSSELVYVFQTLNALKNYNSGSPQPYYMATGFNGVIVPQGYNVPNSSGSYESIVNNIQSGWTAQEVLALVDRIMSQNGGSGSGSGGSSSDNPFGFLGRIGELLSQLVTGVGELLTGLVDGVVNVFLGAEDENGVRHGGLFGTIRDLISQLSTIFSTDISQFVSDIFGWLPSEIITLWTAGIMIAILFGILRIIRG